MKILNKSISGLNGTNADDSKKMFTKTEDSSLPSRQSNLL